VPLVCQLPWPRDRRLGRDRDARSHHRPWPAVSRPAGADAR
jgi:hypothetical protein